MTYNNSAHHVCGAHINSRAKHTLFGKPYIKTAVERNDTPY